MTNFAEVAAKLVGKYGNQVPASFVEGACLRAGVSRPENLPYIKGLRRGGKYDLSAYVTGAAVTTTDEVVAPTPEPVVEEPVEAISGRFEALSDMAWGVVSGHYSAMIVSGNPGTGKTFTLERALEEAASLDLVKYTPVHGFARATGLYKLLYEHREKGNVLLLDDCDSVFGDETALNILKAALDTTKHRTVSWYSEKSFKDENDNVIPSSFSFEGSVIFVTNLDFDRAMGTRLGPHLEALISRSYYLDLNLRNLAQLLAHIATVVRTSKMLEGLGLTTEQGERIVNYVNDNCKKLREISLRTVVKLGNIIKASNGSEAEFERVAKLACCKRGA